MDADELYEKFGDSYDDPERFVLAMEIARNCTWGSVGGYNEAEWYGQAFRYACDSDGQFGLAMKIADYCNDNSTCIDGYDCGEWLGKAYDLCRSGYDQRDIAGRIAHH